MEDQQKRAIDREAFRGWLERPPVEKAITLTDEGAPQLSEEEREKFLGHPRERIVKAFTRSQARSEENRDEIEAALLDPRASAVYISGDIGTELALAWQEAALGMGVPARITDSPKYKGDIGLVVASDEALDLDDIYI
jgi:uncharacterized protein YueI